MNITKEVVFVAKDDTIDELKALLEMMVPASRAEKGCLLYNIYQTIDDPKTFVVIETWEDADALTGHQHSDHYKHYKAHYEPFTSEKYSRNLAIIGE
jgi:quinol monooxygenase YgiN